MDESIDVFWGLPQFMWKGIFNIIISLDAGLIIAFVTPKLRGVKALPPRKGTGLCAKIRV